MVGGRVPDMIFSPADAPVFSDLLKRWGLMGVDDTEVFLKVRVCVCVCVCAKVGEGVEFRNMNLN